MATADLKNRLADVIDDRRREIIEIGETIMARPELGFKELATAELVRETLQELGIECRTGLAITGVSARIETGRPGPTLALIGELDALVVPGHPKENPTTHAAHACGHNAQIAGLMGAAAALADPRVQRELSGTIVIMAVPAEEYVEIEYRYGLQQEGKIEFLGGKPELIARGEFDDVDLAMMIHTHSDPTTNGMAAVAESNNGCVVKQIRYIGVASHAGAAPERGVNALYAAQIGMAGINALRETFRDDDAVRVHPIITHGGDLVNVIPADIRLETYVRGKTTDVIDTASAVIDRALKAGALALGADVEIRTLPGYLPLLNHGSMAELFLANQAKLHGEVGVRRLRHQTGSTDMGDISHIMPALHPTMAGAVGTNHATDWDISDPQMAYVEPAKALAWIAVDLLADGAGTARQIVEDFRPAMTRAEYLTYQRGLLHEERWSSNGK